MPDQVRNTNQRLKILYLYRILTEQTDDKHSISMPEIIRQLERCGISAGRKALYEDIEALRSFGLDIVSGRGGNSGYAVVSREFELPELKLLADAVCSARFLTEQKAQKLVAKLSRLTSVYEARQISRQVCIAGRTKERNEHIYLTVDAIQRAIREGKQISFRYFSYDIRKKKVYRDGVRICTPISLLWSDERYYLVANYTKYPGKLTNFRVDRMEHTEVLDAPAIPPDEPFDPEEYQNETFSMFSGRTQIVKLRFHGSLVNPVIDRFGKDILIYPDGEEHFIVRIPVKAEQPLPFFGWLFQFGSQAQILAPAELRGRYRETLKQVLAAHGDE